MSETDKEIKGKAMQWLNEKDRTKEEIAQKICDAVNVTYELVKTKNIKDEMRLELFKTLLKPPAPVKMKWHGFW